MNNSYPLPATLLMLWRAVNRFAGIAIFLFLLGTANQSLAQCANQTLTPTTGPYCTGTTGVTIGLANTENGQHKYRLLRNGTVVAGPLDGVNGALSFGTFNVAGTYTVTVTRSTGGGCSATMTGSIVIGTPPTVQTVTGSSFCAGTSTVIGLAGSQTGVNYTLLRDGSAVGSAVAGTGSAISFPAQTAAGTYTVQATATSGGCTATMSGSVIGNAAPTAFTVSGGGAYCAGGSGQPVNLSGSQTGVTYQLYRDAATVGSPVSGTGSALVFSNQTVNGTYTIIASNSGCTTTQTGSAVITTVAQPTVFTITGPASFCTGTSTVIGLSSSETGVNYELLRNGSVVGSAVGGTGSAISFPAQTLIGTYTVRGTTTSASCTQTMSGTVTGNNAPATFTLSGGGSYCSGGAGQAVNLSGSESGINYQLLLNGSAIGSPVAGTGSAISFGNQTSAGTYTTTATVGTCTTTMSGSATVTVNSSPTLFTVTGPATFCPPASTTIGLNGSETGVTYELLRDGALVVSRTGTGTAISFTPAQTVAGLYTVRATRTANGCQLTMTGSVNGVSITTYFVTGGGAYCTGGAGVPIGLTNSQVGINYQLYRGATAVGSPVAGTGFALSLGDQTVAGTYTVRGVSGTCTKNMSGSATIFISPPPTVYNVTGGGAYCLGGAGSDVSLDFSDSDTDYQLYLDGVPTGPSFLGVDGPLSFGNQTAVGTYTVEANKGGCQLFMSGNAVVSTIPSPTVFNVTGGGSFCPGGTGVAVGLSSSQTGVTYQLFIDGTATGAALAGTGAALNFGNKTTTGTYTVTATLTSNGCPRDMNGTAVVANYPLPTAFTVTGGGSYCVGGTGSPIGLSGSETGVTYQLIRGGSTNVGAAVSGTGSAISFGNQTTAGTYTVRATRTATSCNTLMSGSTTVSTVTPPLTANTLSSNSPVCDNNVQVTLLTSQSGYSYQLRINTTNTPVGSPVIGTGSSITLTGTAITANTTFNVLVTSPAPSVCTSQLATTITVVKNCAPIANSDYNLVPLNTVTDGNVIINDVDPEFGVLTATLVTLPANGTVTMTTAGRYLYTPTTGYLGSDSFTYQICDNGTPSRCATSTVELLVYDPSTACSLPTGANLIVNPEFTSGNTGFQTNYTYVPPGYGHVTAGVGNLLPEGVYTVDTEANNSHPSFLQSGYGGSGNYLIINGINTIKTLYKQTIAVQPNTYYNFSAQFNNVVRTTLNIPDPEFGFVINNQSVSGTLVVPESPDVWVQYSDVWYSGNSTSAVFEIRNVSTDLNGNDMGIDHLYFGTCNIAPIAISVTHSPAIPNTAGQVLLDSLKANDPDGSIGMFRIRTLPDPTHGVLYLNGIPVLVNQFLTPDEAGELYFDPVAGFVGNATFQFRAFDNANAASSNIGVYTIPVVSNNPAAYSSPNNYNKDVLTIGFTLATVTDPDGAITSASFATGSSLPNWMTLNSTTGAITVNNAASAVAGTYNATINTTDATGGFNAAPVTITIFNDIEAVYTVTGPQNLDAYTNGQSLASVTDANGAITSAVLTTGTLPAGFALNAVTGAVTVSDSALLVAGTYILSIRTTDATGGITVQPVTIVIGHDQEAVYTVTAASHYYFMSNGQTLASVTDADGAITSITLLSGTVPAGTALNTTTGAITVTNANLLVAGSSPLQIRTVDATGGITVQTITIIISGDFDSDGVPDEVDIDDNNDGLTDLTADRLLSGEALGDSDNDGIKDYRDTDFVHPLGAFIDANSDGINDRFDSDRDGIINSFDIDIDNDGITNALEANIVSPTNYDASTGRITGTVGANGMPDMAETSAESGISAYPMTNTDGDLLPDYLDIDSDSDGITDAVEAQVSLGYRARSGSDADRDGLDDAHDATCGCSIQGIAISPIDTDGDGTQDYRDTDADNDGKGDFSEGFDNNMNGYALDDLRDRASLFEGIAGSPGWYTTQNTNNNGLEDWLEDTDGDGTLNYLDPNSSNYHDSDGDGIIDLFDPNTFGAVASPPDANANGIPDYRDGGNIVPLPVQWLSFEAVAKAKTSQLTWITASEKDNDKFIVERSADGRNFTAIGEVSGNGTSDKTNEYQFTDVNPVSGVNYYRLKQLDYSGTSSYSVIRSVRFGQVGQVAELSVYPNPAVNLVQVQVIGTTAQGVEVYSLDGRLIMTQSLIDGTAVVETGHLATGSYIIKVQTTGGVLVKQLLKQ